MDDTRVRASAFLWLEEQVARYGDVLPRSLLATGFVLDGERVPLVGPQGIFKPRVLSEVPLTITTAPGGPYDDSFDANGLLRYRYRGTDPNHPDNQGLRLACRRRLPLAYYHGIVPGKYLVTWPVFVVEDNPSGLYVTVMVDSPEALGLYGGRLNRDREGAPSGAVTADHVADHVSEGRRRYVTAEVRVRLHQRAFRERVLEAYRRQCAFCRFRHEELLDAAHIVPDSHPQGEPVVSNGLALCSLHHKAFDRHFLGVTPDYIIQVRPDILTEQDGPTLVHGLQVLHGRRIVLPRVRRLMPDRDLLAMRYEQFRAAI